MQIVLEVALPFFGLVFLGFGARRLNVLDPAAVRGLNGFVFHFALPALLFVNVAEAPLAALFDLPFITAYYSATAAVALSGAWLGGRAGPDRTVRRALGAFGAVFGNIGYMGVPLAITAFGSTRALPAVLVLTLDNIVLIGLAVTVIEAARGSGGALATLARVGSGLIRNPLILAIAAGLVPPLTGLMLPSPIAAFLRLLAAAAGPCALFALGATLATVPLRSVSGEVFTLTLVKLVVHPAAVALVAGLLLPQGVMAVAVVLAALPTGANLFVLAQRYDTWEKEASAQVFFSHVGAVVTVSAALAWAAG